MFEQKAVEDKIHELYPDIKKYGLFMNVKKDKLIGGDSYVLTLEKDARKNSFKLSRDDVQTCMDGNLCSLITSELAHFIRQFVDESYAIPEAG
ncbi:MAG: hypothetical protein KKB20_26720 [Proteobacteria bacterium]|nr:hypothetical protein [Pseudomonadota bacterium]